MNTEHECVWEVKWLDLKGGNVAVYEVRCSICGDWLRGCEVQARLNEYDKLKRSTDKETVGYVKNCFIKVREGETIFHLDINGVIHPRLDGYVIRPAEDADIMDDKEYWVLDKDQQPKLVKRP